MTEAAQAFPKIVAAMLDRRVAYTRVFLFTLQVYLEPEVEGGRKLEIWCEPNWHVRSSSGVITGSGAIDTPSSYADDVEVDRASATIAAVSKQAAVLVGQTILDINLDRQTFALTVEFSEGITLATFVADPEDEPLWVLKDSNQGLTIRGTPHGILPGSRAGVV